MFNLQVRRECSKSYFDNGIKKNTIFLKVITYKRTREYAASVDSYRTAFTIPIFCITENTKVIFTCDWGGVDGRE